MEDRRWCSFDYFDSQNSMFVLSNLFSCGYCAVLLLFWCLIGPFLFFPPCRMKISNYVGFPRMEQNHFYFAPFKKVFPSFLKQKMYTNPPYFLVFLCFTCICFTGNEAVTAVWEISTWKRIGHKRLLGKPASVMSISKDGKYIAL